MHVREKDLQNEKKTHVKTNGWSLVKVNSFFFGKILFLGETMFVFCLRETKTEKHNHTAFQHRWVTKKEKASLNFIVNISKENKKHKKNISYSKTDLQEINSQTNINRITYTHTDTHSYKIAIYNKSTHMQISACM